MKEIFFKYSTISLILVNLWILYGFFDYFIEEPGLLHGFGLLIFYWYSFILAFILGFILLFLRYFYKIKFKRDILTTSFIYTFCCIFNLNLIIIWIISVSLKILSYEYDVVLFVVGNLMISSFMIIDIYKTIFNTKINMNE
jgi:hypothetical protein